MQRRLLCSLNALSRDLEQPNHSAKDYQAPNHSVRTAAAVHEHGENPQDQLAVQARISGSPEVPPLRINGALSLSESVLRLLKGATELLIPRSPEKRQICGLECIPVARSLQVAVELPHHKNASVATM